MKITNLKVKGGNFAAVINGELLADKLQSLVESGVDYEAERKGMSKVFKGVKVRTQVVYTPEASLAFQQKLVEGLKEFFTADSLDVKVSAREWSEGAGGAQAKAQAAYAEMLALGMTAENAMKVAVKVHAGFVVTTAAKVEEIAPAATVSTDAPMEG